MSCHFDKLTMKHCSRMMFFKFILIFVILTIQNSNSFRKSAEIPGDCKDVECIEKLLRDRLKKEVTTPSGKMKLLLNTT